MDKEYYKMTMWNVFGFTDIGAIPPPPTGTHWVKDEMYQAATLESIWGSYGLSRAVIDTNSHVGEMVYMETSGGPVYDSLVPLLTDYTLYIDAWGSMGCRGDEAGIIPGSYGWPDFWLNRYKYAPLMVQYDRIGTRLGRVFFPMRYFSSPSYVSIAYGNTSSGSLGYEYGRAKFV